MLEVEDFNSNLLNPISNYNIVINNTTYTVYVYVHLHAVDNGYMRANSAHDTYMYIQIHRL